MGVVDIGGWVEASFEPVLDAFAENFDSRGEVGAAVCVYLDGEPIVDLWGGTADATTGRPWAADSVVLVYSSTKGVTSVCANLLIERGVVDPAAPLAQYWPEFAAGGKGAITVAQVLSHQAGLPLVEGDYSLSETLTWDPMVRALAAQAPIWPPGTRHGYHMRTFGWLVGELVRRVDGRTIGTFFRDEIAEPLGLDFWIGLPEAIEPRVARLVPPERDLGELLQRLLPDALLTRVFTNPAGRFGYNDMWNTRELHAAELPSSNGIGDARSLARMYASCIGEVDGVRTLEQSTVAAATAEQACGDGRSAHGGELLRARLHARQVVRRREPCERVRPRRRGRIALVRRSRNRSRVRLRDERPAFRPERRSPQRRVGARGVRVARGPAGRRSRCTVGPVAQDGTHRRAVELGRHRDVGCVALGDELAPGAARREPTGEVRLRRVERADRGTRFGRQIVDRKPGQDCTGAHQVFEARPQAAVGPAFAGRDHAHDAGRGERALPDRGCVPERRGDDLLNRARPRPT